MTTMERFRQLIVSVDPTATKYEGAGEGDYTVWRSYGENPLFAGNHRRTVAVRIQVDRFTMDDPDRIADALYEALEAAEFVAFEHLIDYETNTKYIHHIFDCEVT